jgi:hypothetical protein
MLIAVDVIDLKKFRLIANSSQGFSNIASASEGKIYSNPCEYFNHLNC